MVILLVRTKLTRPFFLDGYLFCCCYRSVCGQKQASRPLGDSRKENSKSIETTRYPWWCIPTKSKFLKLFLDTFSSFDLGVCGKTRWWLIYKEGVRANRQNMNCRFFKLFPWRSILVVVVLGSSRNIPKSMLQMQNLLFRFLNLLLFWRFCDRQRFRCLSSPDLWICVNGWKLEYVFSPF